jgi:hypothetical protein
VEKSQMLRTKEMRRHSKAMIRLHHRHGVHPGKGIGLGPGQGIGHGKGHGPGGPPPKDREGN